MDTFEIKTVIKFGRDALCFLKKLQGKKVLVITDPFMVQSGMISKVTSQLDEGSYQIFSNIVPDPPVDLVVEGIKTMTEYRPNAVVALGGGSAIDAAKAIMHFSKELSQKESVQFIAIPTTSGTGSEVTSFSVITDLQKGIKYPLVSDELLPQTAILDPVLVKSVPPKIVADTGIDVLTHAIEAYVSTSATDFSDALAEKAVQIVFSYLKRSYDNGEDWEAKEKMHNASCIAGIAFNQASLGLNHAIAHNLGGRLHIPHGRINGILLPHVIEFNAALEGYTQSEYTQTAKKYANLARLAGFGASTVRMAVKNLIHEIIKLKKECGMAVGLKDCGVETGQINEIKKAAALGALQDVCMNTNPMPVTENDIYEIIHKSM